MRSLHLGDRVVCLRWNMQDTHHGKIVGTSSVVHINNAMCVMWVVQLDQAFEDPIHHGHVSLLVVNDNYIRKE